MILIFIIGFLLGILYCIIGEKLPLRISGVKEKESNSWILNLFIGALNGLLLVLSYINYDISYEFFASIVVAALFFTIFISDFKYMIILDSPLIISSLAIIVLKFIYFGWKQTGISIFSGIILFILMLLFGLLGKKIFHKEALGGGDVKLAFVMGLILNVRLGLISIIISSLLALPYALVSIMLGRNKEVPYGPFLVSSLALIFIFLEKFQNLLHLLS